MYNVPITHAASLTYLDSLCLPEGPDPGVDLRANDFPQCPMVPEAAKSQATMQMPEKVLKPICYSTTKSNGFSEACRAGAAYTGPQVQGSGWGGGHL